MIVMIVQDISFLMKATDSVNFDRSVGQKAPYTYIADFDIVGFDSQLNEWFRRRKATLQDLYDRIVGEEKPWIVTKAELWELTLNFMASIHEETFCGVYVEHYTWRSSFFF